MKRDDSCRRVAMVSGHRGALAAGAMVVAALWGAAVVAAEGQAGQSKEPAGAARAQGVTWVEEVAETPYAFSAVLTAASPSALSAEILLAAADGSGQVVLRIADGRAQFLAGRPDELKPVGPAGVLRLPKSEDGWEFTVQRRLWRLVFICNGRVVCRGWAAAPAGRKEKVGWRAAGGSGVEDERIQPLGAIYAADDFARPASAEGTWEAASGTWAQKSLREDKQAAAMDATKSTNPFSYYGQAKEGEGPALTAAGYWFWTNYSIEAAVRGDANSVIGLAVCFQDPGNYLAVRWTSKVASSGADRIELVAVSNGATRVLQRARGGFLPRQWYKLRLGYCDGRLVAWVDGRKRLEAATDLFGQGQAALLADGSDGVFFDDIVIRDWEIFTDDFAAAAPGKWAFESGKWAVRGGALRVTAPGEAVAVTGSPQWGDVAVEVAAHGSARGWGVVIGADSPTPALARVDSDGGRQRVAICVREGEKWRELAAADLDGGGARGLSVTVDRGIVRAWCGSATVAAYVPGLGGRVGLWARGARDLAFDDFAVTVVQPPASAHVVKEFTDIKTHFEMAEWASRRHAWAPAERVGPSPTGGKAGDNQWWTKGDYFGDYTFEVPIAGIGKRDISLTLVTDAEPGLVGTGVTVSVKGAKGSRALQVVVSAAGEQLASKSVDVPGEKTTVVCRRNGAVFVVAVGKETVYWGHVIPPPGRKPQAEGKAAEEGESK